MSIGENLAFRRFARRPISSPVWLYRRSLGDFARKLMEAFRIPATDHRLQVAKLSGGGLQRVILAREMTESPDLLVAAQPTRGLDVVSAASIRQQLVAARDAGAGVLLVSEDLDELLELSDRIAVMLGGRVVAISERAQLDRAKLGKQMTGAVEG
jgi:simple sugar transport system ATP-binding protein